MGSEKLLMEEYNSFIDLSFEDFFKKYKYIAEIKAKQIMATIPYPSIYIDEEHLTGVGYSSLVYSYRYFNRDISSNLVRYISGNVGRQIYRYLKNKIEVLNTKKKHFQSLLQENPGTTNIKMASEDMVGLLSEHHEAELEKIDLKIDWTPATWKKIFSVLSKTQKRIMRMFYRMQLTPKEIADRLGCTSHNVSVVIHQSHNLIRENLSTFLKEY